MDLKLLETELDKIATKAADAGIPVAQIIKALQDHAEAIREADNRGGDDD